jgi:hypothetical protein
MSGLNDWFGSGNLFNKDLRQTWDPLAPVHRRVDSLLQGGGGSGGLTADQQFADLSRQQWQDYVKNFVPYENKLIEYSNDPQVVTDAMTGASADARRAFSSRSAASKRGLRELGLTLGADEQRAVDRSNSLAGSLADVSAQNAARDATLARQDSVLGNPSPTIPRVSVA